MSNNALGLVLSGIETEYGLPIVKGVDTFCNEHDLDYYIFLVHLQGITDKADSSYIQQHVGLARLLNPDTVKSVITTATTRNLFPSQEDYAKFLRQFKPLQSVSVGNKVRGASSVTINNYTLYKNLTKHLIKKHGVKKFMLVKMSLFIADIEERVKGFYDALEESGISKDSVTIVETDFVYGHLTKNLEVYKNKNDVSFEAVVCPNDIIAIEAMEYFNKIGVEVPGQLKVVGFDNCSSAIKCEPPLTTVDQCLFDQGYKACEEAIAVSETGKPKNVVVKGNLKLRLSCGCTHTKSQVRKERDASSVIGSDYFLLRSKIHLLQKSLQNAKTTMYVGELKEMLFKELKDLQVPSCTIVTYYIPLDIKNKKFELPEKANIFLHVTSDKDTFETDEELEFNPQKEIIPQKYNPKQHIRLFTPLMNEKYQFGYVVYEPQEFDFILFPTFTSLITNAIASTYELFALTSKNNKLENMSCTDEMTGVLNRRGLIIYGQNALDEAIKLHQKGLVIFADMDGLEKINDTYGHEAGDTAIKAEIAILRETFRTTDIIARYGGDEFVIIAPKMTKEIFELRCSQIDKRSAEWNKTSGQEFELSISLGGTPFNESICDLATLIKKADAIQYEVKKAKKKARGQ
ncbi:MAG: GGDEF domain-containing protein [Treponema sp.]|nr:GGDEF domain-containing protein [Candidatus Treponema scatequi]